MVRTPPAAKADPKYVTVYNPTDAPVTFTKSGRQVAGGGWVCARASDPELKHAVATDKLRIAEDPGGELQAADPEVEVQPGQDLLEPAAVDAFLETRLHNQSPPPEDDDTPADQPTDGATVDAAPPAETQE